jgi:hypothetical protein
MQVRVQPQPAVMNEDVCRFETLMQIFGKKQLENQGRAVWGQDDGTTEAAFV